MQSYAAEATSIRGVWRHFVEHHHVAAAARRFLTRQSETPAGARYDDDVDTYRTARLCRVLCLVLLPLFSITARGESLAEAARRERDRRQTEEGKSGRTFTNKDLDAMFPESRPPAGAPETQPGPMTEPSAEPETAQEPPTSSEPDWGELERHWRQRFDLARERIRDAESRAWQEVIRTEFYQGLPYQVRVREHVETEELRLARRDLEDLREELRRAGMPPGWGR